jgi:diguanylate cyclase (GGDEF)-like protein/PAS domain S-box-containing protein
VEGASVGAIGSKNPIVRMTRDVAGVIISVDDAIVELLGWVPEQLVGTPSTSLIHPADQSGAVAEWMEMITSRGRSGVWRGRYKAATGSWVWVETENRFEDPEVITSMKEVSAEEVSLEEQFQAREQLLSQLSDALPVGIFQVDLSGHITLTNESFHLIVGVPIQDSFEAQTSTVVPDDRPALDAALAKAFAGRSVDGVEIRLRLLPIAGATLSAAQDRVCQLGLRPLSDSSGVVSGVVGCLNDVTDRARLYEELLIRASTDELTDCLNRAATIELVDRTINARHDGLGRAVIFADLDGLKAVNDRLGHAAGDQLIISAARRIKATLRNHDVVGRLGGDEFLVICPRVLNPARAMEIAERISSALTTSLLIGAETVQLRASVGVVWTLESLDTDTLIARADNAMYESKRMGTHGVTLYADAFLEQGSHHLSGSTTPRHHG